MGYFRQKSKNVPKKHGNLLNLKRVKLFSCNYNLKIKTKKPIENQENCIFQYSVV